MGDSYNALYVPLAGGWHSALMPAREVQQVDRTWQLTFEERQRKRKEQKELIEQDRQDFDRLFRMRIDSRGARACSEFRHYVEFISRHLRASNWDLLNGEGVTRVQRAAVRDGSITPVIARSWHGGQRVSKLYAPQQWPATDGGARASRDVLTWREFAALKMANGETSLRTHLLDKPESSDVGNLTSRVSDGGSFEWLSVIDAVGGALAGAALGSTDAESSSVLESFGDSGNDGSLFSDAQPFDYVPDDLGGSR
ncbi:hypothetical protein [Burkholderia sp. 8Y]|uniref:hypothetical protein n=1 Tax=Burkholderia sp. 8Y TaxID=2653133 RepID=UPI0013586E63|nr:hypothetical protein [Burkholderia sp. 8Y]